VRSNPAGFIALARRTEQLDFGGLQYNDRELRRSCLIGTS
jgi:hypothetical protein